jgi:hypothetical protein
MTSVSFDQYGAWPFAAAASSTERLAVAGRYTGITTNSAWVQVFGP